MGMSPQQWLKPGDKVEVNVSKIGTLCNGVQYAWLLCRISMAGSFSAAST